MCDVAASSGDREDDGQKFPGKPGAGSCPGDCVGDLGRREDDLGEGMALRVENCGLVYKAIHKKERKS